MDIIVCTDDSCNNGFLFQNAGFISSFTGFQEFNPSNWSLTAKSVESVPEPGTVVALAMVGGSLLLNKLVKWG